MGRRNLGHNLYWTDSIWKIFKKFSNLKTNLKPVLLFTTKSGSCKIIIFLHLIKPTHIIHHFATFGNNINCWKISLIKTCLVVSVNKNRRKNLSLNHIGLVLLLQYKSLAMFKEQPWQQISFFSMTQKKKGGKSTSGFAGYTEDPHDIELPFNTHPPIAGYFRKCSAKIDF